MIEIYKLLNDTSDNIYRDLFVRNCHSFNLRSNPDLIIPAVNSTLKGKKNSLRYYGSVIWNSLPTHIRNSETLSVFESEIKKWKPNCPCRMCMQYLEGVGFV